MVTSFVGVLPAHVRRRLLANPTEVLRHRSCLDARITELHPQRQPTIWATIAAFDMDDLCFINEVSGNWGSGAGQSLSRSFLPEMASPSASCKD